jgi:uncharacterized membrane protein YbhN (UPF0104 family)
VWYAARGVSWSQVTDAGGRASLWLFVGASLGGFLCWFIGETILYSRLFSYFHGATGSRQLLPTMASVYFLQIINSYVASGAYVLFLHTRKHAPWMTGIGTLLFQNYLDVTLLALLSLFAIAAVPTSPIRFALGYAAAALGAGLFIATFWLIWGPHLSARNWLRWVYERPSLSSFQMARPPHYIKLLSIRCLIFLGAGFSLYAQFASFHIRLPLAQALALTPLIVAIGNSPFSPGGIGTTQLVFTVGFAGFATKGDLFALSLAVTTFNLLVRIPMGLVMAQPLISEGLEVERELIIKPAAGRA